LISRIWQRRVLSFRLEVSSWPKGGIVSKRVKSAARFLRLFEGIESLKGTIRMKLITGIVGGALICVGVFFVTGLFLLPVLPSWAQPTLTVGTMVTNNLLGVVLGFMAGLLSYSAAVAKPKK
jgi:hypothetical protein